MFDDLLTKQQLSRKGQTFEFSGLDSEERCFDIQWYRSFQYPISYKINEMGFRDQNHTSLENKVFVIGDSFTMGIGQPYDHTWPVILENILGEPIIKIACDGISNEWIQSVFDRITHLNPKAVFVMMTFVHRKTIKKKESVEHFHYDNDAAFNDVKWAEKMAGETYQCLTNMMSSSVRLNIPSFFTAVPEFDVIKKSPDIRDLLIQYPRLKLDLDRDLLKKLDDLARDGFHFGKKTCKEIAKSLYIRYREKDR